MRYEAVFFDLYGTLLIYGDMTAAWSAWLTALHDWLTGLGVEIERRDLQRRCDGFFSWPAPASSDPRLTIYEQRLAEFAHGLSVHPSVEQLQGCAEATIGAWQRFVSLDPEALPVLADLSSRCPLALITNFDHPPHVARILDETGLDRHLRSVVISGEIGLKKPDPGIFNPAIEAVGIEPHRIAYVGDAPEDILAADRAGMTPIRLQRDGDTEGDRAADFRHSPVPRQWTSGIDHPTITSLQQLPGLLSTS